jgi:hypothetical protein
VGKNVDFETSSELKRVFNQEFDNWSARHRLGLEELSARCGVSRSYLAHIGRYGRIPSKPVLLLLALNFEMKDPTALLRAARLTEPWPFDTPSAIHPLEKKEDGFLSIKLDMDGFVDAIRHVVRDQFRPRTLKDLLGDRPLRFGLNLAQYWMYEPRPDGEVDYTRGIFPDFVRQMANSLGCEVSVMQVPLSRHVEKLRSGEIDVYGPMLTIPPGPSKTFFSLPINRLGLSAVMRSRPTQNLAPVQTPRTLEELKNPAYEIAVLKDSRAHLLANMRLNRSDERLILCDSDDEALDRVLLRGVLKPAHIFMCTTIGARGWAAKYPDALQAIFHTQATMLDVCDNALAIRPDWPEVVSIINQAVSFVMSTGGFGERIREVTQNLQPLPTSTSGPEMLQIQGMLGMVG